MCMPGKMACQWPVVEQDTPKPKTSSKGGRPMLVAGRGVIERRQLPSGAAWCHGERRVPHAQGSEYLSSADNCVRFDRH